MIRLNVLRWPIWRKLLLGFAAAVLIPAVVVFFISWAGVNEINTRNVRSFITESGTRQAAIVTDSLNEAFALLNDAAAQSSLSGLLQRIGLGLPETALTFWRDQAQSTLDNLFLDVDHPYYLSAWLVDATGTVIMRSGADQSVLIGSSAGSNALLGPAFRTSQSMSVTNRRQNVAIVSPSGTPNMLAINTVQQTAGIVQGYVITNLDLDRLITRNLVFNDHSLPAYSFAMLPGNLILNSPDAPPEDASTNSEGAQLAVSAGRTGFGTYTTGENGDREVIGYYSSIPLPDDRNIALVTEVSSSVGTDQVVSYLSGLAFPLFVGLGALMVVLAALYNLLLTPPLAQLREAIIGMTRGNYEVPVAANPEGDELAELGVAFEDMRKQIHGIIEDLLQRIRQRASDVEATQEISRVAATQRDLHLLMSRVINLLVERFPNIYHAQIFLTDVDRAYAVLEASTGEAGEKLLSRGHRLAIGGVSVIGQVTSDGQTIVARDTATSEVHRRNEFLPETRSELAIPLRFGDQIIGALDVQSKLSNTFSQDQIAVLQTMADQIAVAIENARLYEESLRRLREIEQNNRMTTLRAWEDYMNAQRGDLLTSEAGNATGADISELRRAAMLSGKAVVGEITNRNTVPIAVPISYRGQVLGAVEWELPAQDFSYNKLLLAEELVNRLAISLDNARLFRESQRAAERERVVNEIASKLTGQTDIDEILQIAVREVGQALRAPQVSIQLSWESGNGNGSNGNGTHGSNGGSSNGSSAGE